MNRRILASNLYRHLSCCVLFFVAASASFQGFYAKWHFREAGVAGQYPYTLDGQFGLRDIFAGTATRPYVYRQLLPMVANWLDCTVPQSIKDGLYQSLSPQLQTQDFIFASPLAREPAYFFRYLAIYLLTFLFAWLAVYAMYLACKAAEFPLLARIFAPVLMILAMPYFMSMGGYYYDYPELAFLALALWMAIRFPWGWMIPLVALATWNKESFLLVVLTLYPILRGRNSRLHAWLGTATLALSAALVYFAIRTRFQSNPGGAVLHQWRDQIRFLIHPLNLVGTEITYGVPAFRAFTLIPLALIAWTVWRAWRMLSPQIRRHGLIAAAINFPLFFLFCYPGELRNLSMMYMFLLLSLAANLSPKADGSMGDGALSAKST